MQTWEPDRPGFESWLFLNYLQDCGQSPWCYWASAFLIWRKRSNAISYNVWKTDWVQFLHIFSWYIWLPLTPLLIFIQDPFSSCLHALPSRSVMPSCFVTPWIIAHQALLSMELSRQECFSGLPFPAPGDLPNPGIKPVSPVLADGSFPLSHWRSPFLPFRILQSMSFP